MNFNCFKTSYVDTKLTTAFDHNLWSNALFIPETTSSDVIDHRNQSNVMINHMAYQVDEDDDIIGKPWLLEGGNVLVESPEVVGVGCDTKIEMKAKNPKIAFQTRSQVDILDDGYKWRKYGQKVVKNNKFARNYYKCNYKGCNVKKQVQRLSKDEGVVVTTYEGFHAHTIPMPPQDINHISS
ncbi:probable WRKY transcription factor 75 [Lactuca sativa]|uniref:WRKY domain-containing protein n=1 Tax=Lactuca sativa TaxID=4236 RepID=A0A9R1XKH1_LACSA|nr:probable WRKY transcription factor 75 [Lactuca sativa]KAJ0216129.1 hypothetical protein LSAT_V11C300142810 [Lactuca sativa]